MIIGNAKVVCNGTYGTYYIVQECLRGSQALFMPVIRAAYNSYQNCNNGSRRRKHREVMSVKQDSGEGEQGGGRGHRG